MLHLWVWVHVNIPVRSKSHSCIILQEHSNPQTCIWVLELVSECLPLPHVTLGSFLNQLMLVETPLGFETLSTWLRILKIATIQKSWLCSYKGATFYKHQSQDCIIKLHGVLLRILLLMSVQILLLKRLLPLLILAPTCSSLMTYIDANLVSMHHMNMVYNPWEC